MNFLITGGFEDIGALYYFSLGHASPESLLGVLAPLIVTIPFASSFAIERNTGYFQTICYRVEKRKYLTAKLIANSLTGGAIIGLPLILCYTLLLISFGNYAYPNPTAGPFGYLAVESPTLYGWYRIIISIIFGAVYATIGLAASTLFNKAFFANIVPFLVFILPALLFPFLGLDRYEPSTTWSPNLNANTTNLNIFSQLILLFFISVLVFIYGTKKKVGLYEKTE